MKYGEDLVGVTFKPALPLEEPADAAHEASEVIQTMFNAVNDNRDKLKSQLGRSDLQGAEESLQKLDQTLREFADIRASAKADAPASSTRDYEMEDLGDLSASLIGSSVRATAVFGPHAFHVEADQALVNNSRALIESSRASLFTFLPVLRPHLVLGELGKKLFEGRPTGSDGVTLVHTRESSMKNDLNMNIQACTHNVVNRGDEQVMCTSFNGKEAVGIITL